MKLSHLEFLCDPTTHEPLELINPVIDGEDVISGQLRSSHRLYNIIRGIPRFVSDEGYSTNFGYQWNKWARVQFEDQNKGRPMAGHTTAMFSEITCFSKEALTGKTVVDIGCGPGRFTDVALRMGARVIAVDYSSAIDAAADNFKDAAADVLFVQGDALQLPIKSDSVDYSFSIGVLHHTPSPAGGVVEAYRILKDKGKFALRVYNSGGFYTWKMVQFWRRAFEILRPVFGYYPPLIYSYVFGTIGYCLGCIWRPLSYPVRLIFPTAWLPDYRWAILDTFDAVATTYQSGHTPEEVLAWLKQAGFTESVNISGNDFVATKRHDV